MLVLGISELAYSQSQNLMDKRRPDAYAYVEKMPDFPGGRDAMYAYLSTCMSSDTSLSDSLSGYVIVQFYVELDGTITSPVAIKSPDPILSAAAVKYVSAMPKWKPAMMKNAVVACVYTLSVKFGNGNARKRNNK
jgi:protein TonB